LYGVRKNILLGVKKAKRSLQSSKTEFEAPNQYGRAIYPSIGNFAWVEKIYFWVNRVKISPQTPKREFGAQN
jgi:hypothetical protein